LNPQLHLHLEYLYYPKYLKNLMYHLNLLNYLKNLIYLKYHYYLMNPMSLNYQKSL